MGRRPAAVLVTAAGVLLALGLSACGQQDGLALARQACGHVEKSFRLYSEAQHTSSSAETSKDLQEANNELQIAEPLAAAATSDDGQWNALMTTLQEIGRVDEGHLLVALRAQCDEVNSSEPNIAPTPRTFPPIPSSG